MGGRRWATAVLVLALGCLAIGTSGAVAKPKPPATPGKALPLRGCDGLLTLSSFPEAVIEEAPAAQFFKGIEVSVCNFRMFNPEGAVAYIFECAVEPIPPMCSRRGGNDSLVVASAALYRKHPQAERRRGWPAGFERKTVPGLGTNAEFGYNDSPPTINPSVPTHPVGFGWLQVRNDVFSVEGEGPILSILQRVAHELSPTGK